MKDFFKPGCQWFWHPDRKSGEAGYTLFRRRFYCQEAVELHLAVSADNRYNLYLDGQFLGRGPCPGDLAHYPYEEYTRSLAPGDHILAMEVVVWSGGWMHSAAPWGEIHAGGGALVCGSAGAERFLGPENWLCLMDSGRRPLEWPEAWHVPETTPIPPMDRVDFRFFHSNWITYDFEDSFWQKPVGIAPVCLSGIRCDPGAPWQLEARRTAGMCETPVAILRNLKPGIVPAGQSRFTIDLGRNQTSMIRFSCRGGRGEVRLHYSEQENVPGYADLLIPDSGP